MSTTDKATKLRGKSGTQARILSLLAAGHTLMWFGDAGPEMSGFENWPQKRTVRAMIRANMLRWCEPLNETHRECGIVPLEVVHD